MWLVLYVDFDNLKRSTIGSGGGGDGVWLAWADDTKLWLTELTNDERL